MSIKPSREQQGAIDCGGNVVITARPGSGKTFTLSRMIARDSANLLSYQGIIAISYTNKASDELRMRCERLGVERMHSFFGTIDKFCLGQVVIPFVNHLIGKKIELDIIEDQDCPEWCRLKGRDVCDAELNSFIKEALRKGEVPLGMLGPAALLILDEVQQARVFIKARYTRVFIDEYQDCGIYQHQMLLRLIQYGLRGVAVGDIDQAIFRFADKSPEYLSELMRAENFTFFEITQNHRCDRAIQAYSRALLSVPVAPIDVTNRRVFEVRIQGDESSIAQSIHVMLPRIMKKYSIDDSNKIAIIGFSNNILKRIDCAIGWPSKMFAKTPLDNGFSKWKRVFADLLISYYDPAHFPGDFLDAHLGIDMNPAKRNKGFRQLKKFYTLNEDELSVNISLAVAIAKLCEPDTERDGDVDAYRGTVSDIVTLQGGFKPAQPGEINILTYHKAKGLEYDVVFCLEAYQFIMPPYKACEEIFDAYGQSLAMHYVGITRAKKACYILLGTKRHRADGIEKDAQPSEFLQINNLQDLRTQGRWPVPEES